MLHVQYGIPAAEQEWRSSLDILLHVTSLRKTASNKLFWSAGDEKNFLSHVPTFLFLE